jgi:hypothetical protein
MLSVTLKLLMLSVVMLGGAMPITSLPPFYNTAKEAIENSCIF